MIYRFERFASPTHKTCNHPHQLGSRAAELKQRPLVAQGRCWVRSLHKTCLGYTQRKDTAPTLLASPSAVSLQNEPHRNPCEKSPTGALRTKRLMPRPIGPGNLRNHTQGVDKLHFCLPYLSYLSFLAFLFDKAASSTNRAGQQAQVTKCCKCPHASYMKVSGNSLANV